MPQRRFIAHRHPKDEENVNTPTASRPTACTPSWWNEPVYTSPPVPVARFAASAGTANKPVASVPHTPDIPCTATAPIGSSMPSPSTHSTPTTAMTPDTSPITTAAHGATKPDAAVIATSAASTPLSIIETSGLRRTIHAMQIPPMPPAAAARFVVSAT